MTIEEIKSEDIHQPVMLPEVLTVLNKKLHETSGLIKAYEGTLGLGGHTAAILSLSSRVIVFSSDRDGQAIEIAKRRLATFGERANIAYGKFSETIRNGDWKYDFVLLDLGVSSMQLDKVDRGFSFRGDAALDMRMDKTKGITAAEMIEDLSEFELRKILLEGGLARVHSVALAKDLKRNLPKTTLELLRMCERIDVKGQGLAVVVFQALRIAVNDEFGEIKEFFDRLPDAVNPKAVVAIISFHSTEDKLVTSRFRSWSTRTATPRGLPDVSSDPLGKLLTKSPIKSTPEEVRKNPRARSAMLRIFEFN